MGILKTFEQFLVKLREDDDSVQFKPGIRVTSTAQNEAVTEV